MPRRTSGSPHSLIVTERQPSVPRRGGIGVLWRSSRSGDKETSIVTEIERYCVQPGQACAYMIGRQTINRLRQEATAGMGARFDLKSFHDLLMATGAVPLNVLAGVVGDWAAPASSR